MKIGFVHGITEIGGAEKELLQILMELKKRDFVPIVICPDEGPLIRSLAEAQIEAKTTDFPPWRKISSVFRKNQAVRSLGAIFDQEKVDVVHVNDIWWVPQTLRALKSPGNPGVQVLAHVRQEIEAGKVQRYELHKVCHLYAVSHQIKNSLVMAGIEEEKICVLHSGVSFNGPSEQPKGIGIRQQYGVQKEDYLLGTVASLFPRKGYEVLLNALCLLKKSHPNVHVFIVGKGDSRYKKMLEMRVRESGMEGRVHFLGFQENVLPILDALDLYVHPALMEGFGIAVLEAMATGKPVVATRVGGIPEIIIHQQTGLLVEPGDAGSLADAISTLLEDSNLRRRFQASGRERAVKFFSIDRMMQELVSSYHNLSVGKTTRQEWA